MEASSLRRGAKQLAAPHNSSDGLSARAGGWAPLETSDSADMREGSLSMLQSDEISGLETEVEEGANQHPQRRGPPPVPPEARASARRQRPPTDAAVAEMPMDGSLERAVRVLGGEAPPLDDAVAELNQARDLELAADDEMSALTEEFMQVLTPVKPASVRTVSETEPIARAAPEPDSQAQLQMQVWFDGQTSSTCGSRWVFVPSTVLLLLSGMGCFFQFSLKVRCSNQLHEGGGRLAVVVAGAGFAVFWVCMTYAHLDYQRLIRPNGPLAQLAQTSRRVVAPKCACSLRWLAWLYLLVGFAISMCFVALAAGIVGLILEDPTSVLTQAAADFFPTKHDCGAVGAHAVDLQRSYWFGLLTAVSGCILVWRHTALAISALLGVTCGVDAIRSIRCHVTRGGLDTWDSLKLSALEKQDWRDAVGTCLATRFDHEAWNAHIVVPILRLTRRILPTLSTWSPSLASATVGASTLTLGILPFALATKNILALALPLCMMLMPIMQTLPMLYISSECSALCAALNDIMLECPRDTSAESDGISVDVDQAHESSMRRVSGVLQYLERVNSGQGPGVVGCGGMLLTKTLCGALLASFIAVAGALVIGVNYLEVLEYSDGSNSIRV